MKKLLSKKANVFGKKVPVFVIALIAVIGLATAALVPYLSGMVTGDVTVTSPLELSFTMNSPCSGDSESGFTCSIYGGDIIGTEGTLTNNAYVDVPGVVAMIFYDTDGEGIEFSSDYGSGMFPADPNQIETYTSGSTDYYIVLQGGHFDSGAVVSDNTIPADSSQGPHPGQVEFATNIYPDTYNIVVFAVAEGETPASIVAYVESP